MLPPRGTNNRRLMDVLFAHEVIKRQQINRCMSDISRPAIIKMLDSEIGKGNVSQSGQEYALTEQARELYRREIQAPFVREFKPLQQKNMVNAQGTRSGSDWSRDVYKSKHV